MEKIKKTIKEFAQKIDAEILEFSLEENNIYVNLKAFGLTEILNDIEYILAKIINKKNQNFVYLFLDINGKRKKEEEQLKQAIQVIADQVALLKKEKILNPMNSYKRRIVHLEIKKRSDVETESVGEDKERKIIIKPL